MRILDSFFAQVPQRRERKRTNQCSKLPAVVVGRSFLLERQSEKRESANFRLRRRRLTNDPCLKNPFCGGPIIWLTQNTYLSPQKGAYVASNTSIVLGMTSKECRFNSSRICFSLPTADDFREGPAHTHVLRGYTTRCN